MQVARYLTIRSSSFLEIPKRFGLYAYLHILYR